METTETNSPLEYGKPPWVFKGSALYQLHLVKAETARAFIPKEFKLVEAFGYTLGGFFLANYEDSPAGIFDELVVIAGIVWNPPTSCAWAARVLVNSDKACVHGQKDVGLPSQVANFTKRVTALPGTKKGQFGGILSKIGMAGSPCSAKNSMDIQVKEMNNHTALNICSINLSAAAMASPSNDSKKWMGPAIKISLPSFSGRTEYNPHLLKYACQIECRFNSTYTVILGDFKFSRHNFFGNCFLDTLLSLILSSHYVLELGREIEHKNGSTGIFQSSSKNGIYVFSYDSFSRLRVVSPAKVSGPSAFDRDGEITSDCASLDNDLTTRDARDYKRNLSISVMLSKPILALEFNCLQMKVEAPTMVPQYSS